MENSSLSTYFGQVEYLSGQLIDVIDRSRLVSACQQGRYKDRMFYYEGIVQDACSRVFYRSGSVLYWYNGSIWVVLSSSLLRDALRDALHRIASDFFPDIRSDLHDGLSRLLGQSCNGCRVLGLSKGIVGFRNCVVDFRDIHHPVVHGFGDGMPILGLLPYDYDPDAVCPVWLSFLSQVLRPSQIRLLQKFLGLGCVERSRLPQRVESTLWLIGSGANGKSTIQGVVEGVFGSDMVSTTRLDFLLCRKPEDQMRQMATIVGKVFNYADEVSEADISHNSDTFKALCSGEQQSFRLLGNNVSSSHEIPFLICNMNHRPQIKNLDKAIVRRLLQIEFEASVSEEDMDLELGNRLRGEYSGIRNWMREGYLLWERDGYRFGNEDTLLANDETLKENERNVDVFLHAMGFRVSKRAGHLDEEPSWILADRLYQQYVRWCTGHDEAPDTLQSFGKKMKEMVKYRRVAHGMCYALFSDGEVMGALKGV